MKIKVSIVESDKNYLERILDGFSGKYADKLEVYAYSSLEQMQSDKSVVADIYMICDSYSFDKKDFSDKSVVVYFVDSKEIETLRGEKTIAKYQKLDEIYRQISDLYADISGIVVKEKHGDGNLQIYLFTSGMGGVGKTTLAVGAAHNLAMKGKRVLYIPLEVYGNSDVHFERTKNGDLGNVIYSIKSKKSNLSLKLSTIIESNFAGVAYISSPQNSYDVGSLTKEDIEILLNEIAALNQYEYVIFDTDAGIGRMLADIAALATRIIYVTESTKTAIYKEINYIKSMKLLEHKNSSTIVSKMVTVANKSKRGQGDRPADIEVACVGAIDAVPADDKQLVEILSKNTVLQKALA